MRKTKTQNLRTKQKNGLRPTARKDTKMTNSNTTSTASLNLTINSKKKAIVMSKKFAKAARLVGSPEYNMLQQARNDYPTYRVETKTTKAKANNLKGLTYQFMTLYIKKHDESKLDEFTAQITPLEDVAPASYVDVKGWFFIRKIFLGLVLVL